MIAASRQGQQGDVTPDEPVLAARRRQRNALTSEPTALRMQSGFSRVLSMGYMEIEQIGSPIRRRRDQRHTLIGLKLNKIGRVS
jgi:hypothetical protein